MVNVFILNLLGAALCAVITWITRKGLEGKAILRGYFCWRRSGDDGAKGAIRGKTAWPPHTAAQKASKVAKRLHKSREYTTRREISG
jgi:hypothetical protein